MTETALIHNLRVRSCPVCHHLEQRMAEYFAELQGLLSRDEDARSDYAVEGGLCPLHTWQLAQFSSPRGVSRGHGAISRRLAEHLDRLGALCAGGETVRLPVQAPDSCRACRFLANAQARHVEAFSAFLEEEENLARYERSHGLCLGHLQLVLARTGDRERNARLIRAAADRLREIGGSMQQYDAKLEQLQREQLTRDEKDAYRRCLVMLSGERTVFSPFMRGT